MGASAPWERVQALVAAGDLNAVALALDDLDPHERTACASAFRRHLRTLDGWDTANPALGVVAAAVLADAKSVVAAVTRYGVSAPHAAFVLTRRDVPWLPELVDRLAAKLPRDRGYYYENNPQFDLLQLVRASAGLPAPATDGFVVGFMSRASTADAVVDAFAADPTLVALVPRIFEIDACTQRLGEDYDVWSDALLGLVQRGVLERSALVSACVARLARPGKPGASHGCLQFARRLDLTDWEVAAHVDEFVSMLRGPTISTIATYAQERLFTQRLTDRLAQEFSLAALHRNEKKVVRAQLSWIRRLMAERSAPHLGAVALALPALTSDIARLAAKLVPTAPEEPPASTRTLEPFETSRLEPLKSLSDVRAEFEAYFSWMPQVQARQVERLVDALIRWRRVDQSALRAALAPVLAEYEHYREFYPYSDNRTLSHGVLALACTATGLEPMPHHPREVGLSAGAVDLAVERLFALDVQMRGGPGGELSIPSQDNGTIASDALLERMRAHAALRLEPYAIELEQALLRLVPPADAPRYAALLREVGTPSAHAAAEWVSGGADPGAPGLERVFVARDDKAWDYDPHSYEERTIRRWSEILLRVVPPARSTDGMWTALCDYDPRTSVWTGESYGAAAVVWLAPRHREVVTAHLLTSFVSGGCAELLPTLASTDGAFGDATALALLYTMTSQRAERRAYAVRAAIILCRRRILDGTLTGELLGDLVSRGAVRLNRVVAPLRAMVEAGAVAQVWDVLRSALPLLLTHPGAALADVLALAVESARGVGARGGVPGLAQFAARKGSARQLVEARLLNSVLTAQELPGAVT